MFSRSPDRCRTEIAPGAIHIPCWLPLEQQRQLIDACRVWAVAPVPMRAARPPGGGVMSVQTVCLGWHWQPYRYSRTADDAGGARVAEMPDWLVEIGREAVDAAYEQPADPPYTDPPYTGPPYTPDAALINYYDGDAKMGMHQDKDERTSDPVVSLSIGDACRFRFGNTETRAKPYTDIELRSGDLFVFGGESRFAFHGVTKTLPGTADHRCGLQSGRINITMRVTGLSG